jgi:hypothetical protein
MTDYKDIPFFPEDLVAKETVRRVWWRCYSDLPKHKKLWRLPDNNARWAWVVMLCAASETHGVFESDQHIEAVIGTQNAKWLAVFRRVGLLDGLVVHDWDEWQETPQDASRAERLKKSAQARERYERLELNHVDDNPVPVRTMKEWLEYVVGGPNPQGRLTEFIAAQFGIIPDKNDYGRVARLIKSYPGGIPALMSAVCEAALRDVKGDYIAYITKLGQGRAKFGATVTTTTRNESRDSFVE